MHMQLLPNDRVVIYDLTDFGTSNISLPHTKCLPNSTDCTAHSVEYDITFNTVRPISVLTNFWCSSGSLMADGRLVQTGGYNNGYRVVRVYESCDTCDWKEIGKGLNRHRWYATNHILPGGGRQIIIGGRDAFSYEFYPKISSSEKAFNLPFLSETNNRKIENNLYPFVFLTPEGHLFIFANNRAILLDYTKNKVLKTYPTIPGGHPRNYPSTGSAVLLPLKMKNGSVISFGILVCGGAPKGAFVNAQKGKFNEALDTCGRIKITDPNPQWEMNTMPIARVMGDMVLLPNGHVLIINGASAGTGGWEFGRNPVLSPVIYRPKNPIGSLFEVQNPSTIPRMYHSTAILVQDGRVLIGGSNPHQRYVFKNVLYPTELSLEAFSPSYLESSSSKMRPNIISPKSKTNVSYGDRVIIRFAVTGPLDPNSVTVTLGNSKSRHLDKNALTKKRLQGWSKMLQSITWTVTSDRAVCRSTQRTRVQTLPEEITTASLATQFPIKGLHCFGRGLNLAPFPQKPLGGENWSLYPLEIGLCDKIPTDLVVSDRIGSRSYDLDPDPTIPFTILQIYDLIAIRLGF
ncbi:hypothetical protein LXL04_008806 [Taraxacum kok-saghyz]